MTPRKRVLIPFLILLACGLLHFLVVLPIISSISLSAEEFFGGTGEPRDGDQADQSQTISSGNTFFLICHAVTIIVELFLVLYFWFKVLSLPVICPVCKSRVRCIEKQYSPVSTFICDNCGHREVLGAKVKDGGG